MTPSIRLVRTPRRRRLPRRAWRRQPEWATRPAPAVGYGDCLEQVQEAGVPWERLLEYDRQDAPAPEEVVGHVLAQEGSAITVADWGTLLHYIAVRCAQEPWHYRPALQYVDQLLRRYDFCSRQLISATAGIAIHARDAATAVSILKATGTFHERPYTWTTVPQVVWVPDMELGALARLHLHATKFYARYAAARTPSVLMGLHACLVHAAVRNDQWLFWEVVRAIGTAWGGEGVDSQGDGSAEFPLDTLPLLLPESIELLRVSSADGRLVPASLRGVVAALLRRAGRELTEDLPLLPRVEVRGISA